MPTTTLADIRRQYPEYDDLPDEQFVDGFYRKFYSDIPREQFNERIGLSAQKQSPLAAIKRYGEIQATYPGVYNQMRSEGSEQFQKGIGQIGEGSIGSGALNTLGGAFNYTSSPINALLRTAVGQPVEEGSGIPKELAEFAASMAIPGMAMTKVVPRSIPRAPLSSAATEFQQAAQRQNVPLPRAISSESMVPQRMGVALSNVPGAGEPLVAAAETARKALGESAKGVSSSLGAGERVVAGTEAKSGLLNWIQKGSGRTAKDAYDDVATLVDPHKTTPLTNTADAVFETANRRMSSNLEGLKNPAMEYVLRGMDNPQGLTYEAIKDMRSIVREMKDETIIPGGFVRTEIEKVYQALTKDLKESLRAAGGDPALAAWEKANVQYRLLSKQREALSKVVGIKGDAAPEQVFERIIALGSSKSRGDINKLSLVQKTVGNKAWDEIGSALINRLGRDADGNFSTARFIGPNGYNSLTPEARNILFSHDHRRALDDIALLSREFEQRFTRWGNPSGTGRTMTGALGLAGVVTAPVPTLAIFGGGRIMAEILARPATAKQAAQLMKAHKYALTSPGQGSALFLAASTRSLAESMSKAGLGSYDDIWRQLQGTLPARTEEDQP